MEQVLPETSFGYRPLQVLVRGGHQTDVRGVFPGGADRFVASFLQGTQQEHLCPGRKVTDLIQEQRAPISRLEQPAPVTVGSGERPLAVPKKFRFGKIAGNGSAVHRDKRLVPTVALFMQFAGDMLLSRTGGSSNEHGNVGTCHQPH